MVESGVSGMRFSVSETAEWGDYVSGPRVINASSKKSNESYFEGYPNGKFTSNGLKNTKLDYRNINNFNQMVKNTLLKKLVLA